MRGWPLVVLSALVLVGACGDDDDGAGGKNPNHADGGPGGSSSGAPGPQCTDCTPAGPMTFKLPSPAGATLWTTPTMEKVLREAVPPTNAGDAIQMYAAKNEFEPFQLVVHADADSSVTLAMPSFGGAGNIPRIEVKRVEYVTIAQASDASSIPSGEIPDPLWPSRFERVIAEGRTRCSESVRKSLEVDLGPLSEAIGDHVWSGLRIALGEFQRPRVSSPTQDFVLGR